MKTQVQVQITNNQFNQVTKEAMWDLYRNYYNYSREYFMQRIERNNYFALYTLNGTIVGFTGLRINRTEIDGKDHLLIYFGQTIIHHAHRGNGLIPRTATKLMLKYWKDLVRGRIYVWADSLTYKAYLVFAKTLKEYYPTYRTATPEPVRHLIQFVGSEYYDTTFCPHTGTIRKPNKFVTDPSTQIDLIQEKDTDIRFFAVVNPQHVEGHGLITMAPMHLGNYIGVVGKSLKKVLLKKGRGGTTTIN